MKNIKLIGQKLNTKKTKDGHDMFILETKLVDNPVLCKECKKNNRVYGSSRCDECANKYRVMKLAEKRLKKKVDEATQIIN
jgi:hypothetical protein